MSPEAAEAGGRADRAASLASRQESPPRVRARTVVALTVLAALVYASFLAASDLPRVAAAWGRLRLGYLGAALMLVLLGYALRVVRWRTYLRRLGHDVDPGTASLTFMAGFALGVTPGKLGELAKAYYLWEAKRTPYTDAFAAVVAERLTDAAAIALLLVVGLLGVPGIPITLGWSLVAIVVAAVLVLRSARMAAGVLSLLRRVPLVRRAVAYLERLHGRVLPLLDARTMAIAGALSLAAWALEPLAMVLLAQGLGLRLSFLACAFVFTAASLGGVLTFVPGGLAVTEGGMVGLLLLFGIDLPDAVALTFLMRGATLWFSVLLGIFAVGALRLRAAGQCTWRRLGAALTDPALRLRAAWDVPVALSFAVASAVIGITHRSRTLNGWDSVLFALGTEHYDVTAARPHPPGYPVYIAAARLAKVALHDANAALVAVSILAGAATVALLYGFLRELTSVRGAAVAALLFLFAPVFVFNSVIALSYTCEGAGSVAVAWLAWRAHAHPTRGRLAALACVFGLLVGVRQSLLLYTAPVVAWAFLARPRDVRTLLRRAATPAVVGVGVVLAWFVPMIVATGGYASWKRATALQSGWVVFSESVFTKGLSAFTDHAMRLRFYLHFDEPVWWLAASALVALFVLARKDAYKALRWPTGLATLLAAWLLPSLTFFLLVFDGWDKGPTGYVLVLLPGLYMIVGLLVDASLRLIERGAHWRRPAGVAVVPVALLVVGSLHAGWPVLLHNEVESHDAWIESWGHLRATLPPDNTTILARYSWAYAKWYFPDYVLWSYLPVEGHDGPSWLLTLETRDHEDDIRYYDAHYQHAGVGPHTVPASAQNIVVMDFQLAGENGGTRRIAGDVDIREARLDNGWRVLLFHPTANRTTIESYFRPVEDLLGP